MQQDDLPVLPYLILLCLPPSRDGIRTFPCTLTCLPLFSIHHHDDPWILQNGQPGSKKNLCPLWENVDQRHADEVRIFLHHLIRFASLLSPSLSLTSRSLTNTRSPKPPRKPSKTTNATTQTSTQTTSKSTFQSHLLPNLASHSTCKPWAAVLSEL